MIRYLTIYWHLLKFSFKDLLTYRLNFFILLLYGPVYVFVLYLVLQIAFQNTTILAGWNRDEALLLFSTFQLVYVHALILFLDGFRYFLWRGFRLGDLDMILVKPVAPQFLVAFSRPNLHQIILEIWILYLFITNFLKFVGQVPLINLIGFIVTFVLAHLLVYLSMASYFTLGFFVVKAQQIIEIFDKTNDFSQYPLGVFPLPLQMVFHTLIPTAFFGFIPVAILLDKLPFYFVGLSILASLLFYVLNRNLWSLGLRHYSSASS